MTRYQSNATATNAQQAGNDVIAIDPTTGGYLSRINLDAYAATGAGVEVLARPDRALIADGRVVVSLNQIDASYATYGDGAVVVINPANDTVVASVALPGLYDCEGMDFVAASHTLLVACGGGFGGGTSRCSRASRWWISARTRRASTTSSRRWRLTVTPSSSGWVLAAASAAAPNRAFAATFDPKGIAPDALFQFDFVSGAVTPVTSADAFRPGCPRWPTSCCSSRRRCSRRRRSSWSTCPCRPR